MYSVRLECPGESTKRSRPAHWASVGSCRRCFWNRRVATGASDIAVPGWPLPTFCTASAASTRTVSTVLRSRSVHENGEFETAGSSLNARVLPWVRSRRPRGGGDAAHRAALGSGRVRTARPSGQSTAHSPRGGGCEICYVGTTLPRSGPSTHVLSAEGG